ncbi:MAG: 7-carboxy-7-deazaguanine synthase QueE [Prevotella sp.]|nr:7-carboxy-7-deazaguanine synthase QueE [Prevotella sp.]
MSTYRINDIFYTLQGEGRNTGRAAVFIRFAGCNLRCPFCDTAFDTFREMTAEEILHALASVVGGFPADTHGPASVVGGFPADILPLVVLTGGEPTLQVDEAFVDLLHQHGYEVAMESNGILPAPKNLDWLTVSPKGGEGRIVSGEGSMVSGERRMADEIKVVFDENTPAILSSLQPFSSSLHPSPLLYLQPCDTGDPSRNAAIIQQCVDYIKHHPQWRLSLQTHKLIGIE